LNRTAVAGPAADAGYAIERERGALVVALPSVIADVMSLLRQHGTLYDAAATRPDAEEFRGRGAAYRMVIAGSDCIVRHYRRGGTIARVLHDEYLRAGEPRPLRELHASIAARARGVDTPEVVAAIAYLSGPLYRADLATRFVPDSRNLANVLFGSLDQDHDRTRERTRPRARVRVRGRNDEGRNDEGRDESRENERHDDLTARADESVRAAAWHATGRLLRSAFAAGVEHPDLNLRNILIAGPAHAPRALLLDLDRAVVRAHPVSDAARSSMLARLHRSRLKLEKLAAQQTGELELAALEAGSEG
jgi:hypothetical protein